MAPEIKVRRILFATDFLESSRLALDYAVAFAEHFKAVIVMLHVVELSQAARAFEVERPGQSMMRKFDDQRLETLAVGVRRLGLSVEVHTDDGIPCEVILRAVETYKADLLVLGVHGVHRGLGHLLLGSNTEKILSRPPVQRSLSALRCSPCLTCNSTSTRSFTFPTSPRRPPPPLRMPCFMARSSMFLSRSASCCLLC